MRYAAWRRGALLFVALLLLTGVGMAAQDRVFIDPGACSDSGGDCNISNVETLDNLTERQNGHVSQTRFIETRNNNTSAINRPDEINEVFAEIDRHETGDDGDATIRLVVTRPSDGTNDICDLSIDNTEDDQYDRCNLTDLIGGSNSKESDVENLTISYRTTGLGSGSNMLLDHTRVIVNYTDSTPPDVTLNSPTDNFSENDTNVNFTFTPSDTTSGVASCDLSINGSVRQTDSSITEDVENWMNESVPEGKDHFGFVNCTDTSANSNAGISANITFHVDVTNPSSVTLHDPTPANATTVTEATQTINFTGQDNLADSMTCTLVVDGTDQTSTSATNDTATTIDHTFSDGINKTYHVRCADQASNTQTSETRWITVDERPPKFTDITHTPSDQKSLDPNTNVTVQVNVTDVVGRNTVLLQFRNASVSTFTNRTMQQEGATDRFNATFNATTEENWLFRIWANDTSGNTNTSKITNISVEFERTWEQTNDVAGSHAVLRNDSDVFAIGNITLNNTGDVDINFTVDSTRSQMTFNGTEKNPLHTVVNGAGDQQFNVTFNKSGLSVGEYPFTINISATEVGGNFLSSENITGEIIIQNVQGPWLDVTITNFDNEVTQGDSGIEMTAEVENEGTGDGTNVTLNWTLPSGWSITSGNASIKKEILLTGKKLTNDITVKIAGNAPTGEKTITAEAGSDEDSTSDDAKTDSKTVTVNGKGGGGGGGDGGGGGVSRETTTADIATEEAVQTLISGERLFTASSFMDVVRGQGETYEATITHPIEQTTMENVSVSVSGEKSAFFSVSPSVLRSIAFNETRAVNITIAVPGYEGAFSGEVTLNVRGTIVGRLISESFSREQTVDFRIHTLSREEAEEEVRGAQGDVEQMRRAGLVVREAAELAARARDAFDRRAYDEARSLADRVRQIRERAFAVQEKIQSLEQRIGALQPRLASILGIPQRFTESEELLRLARAAADRGDYETAAERADEAELALGAEQEQFDPLFFALRWWWAIILAIALFSGGGITGYYAYLRRTITRRIQDLNAAEESVREQMADLQEKYYVTGDMSRDTFQRELHDLQKRIGEIREERTELRHQRIDLLDPEHIVSDLEEEREEVIAAIEELQGRYFRGEEMAKSRYEQLHEIYHERLAEIEEEAIAARLERALQSYQEAGAGA